ncbi:hypothetical protein FA039_13220 [Escherichia coli]|nr:hypothetical protein [Escherichia coli]
MNELYAARLQRSPSIAVDAVHFESTSGATSNRVQNSDILLPAHTTAPSLKNNEQSPNRR